MKIWFLCGAAAALGVITFCELAVRVAEWRSPDFDIDWGLPPL